MLFSIGDNWSFDDGVAAKYGCVVRAFDPRLVNAMLNYAVYMSCQVTLDMHCLKNTGHVCFDDAVVCCL